MTDTYEVLQTDGSVREFRADQFGEIRRVPSREDRDELRGQGWLALDEEIEEGEAPKPKAALAAGADRDGGAARGSARGRRLRARALEARGRGPADRLGARRRLPAHDADCSADVVDD